MLPVLRNGLVITNDKNLKRMKLIKLTFIVSSLLLWRCSPTDRKTTSLTGSQPADTLPTPELESPQADDIKSVIALFKTGDPDKIAGKIHFPLNREYPIPAIKDKEEFKQRFSEVFDKVLIDKIANSKVEQWSEVGWRGIMFENGILWMANSDGVITAVNYQSDVEKKLRQDLITKDKQNLHASLKTFESPVYKIKTKKYLIRIDKLTDSRYRYASWKITEKESSKPDIILDNGELEADGNGGNHVITFSKDNYTYKIHRILMGAEGSPEVTLEVEKDGKLILAEDGELIME